MKKTTICIVMALLCQNFRLQAQEGNALDVTLKGMQIGQKVPGIAITNLHNYRDAGGRPASTAKLTDFKGKLLILDFWATWCGPCVGMMPRLDSLQRVFGEKVAIVSVSYQGAGVVLPFMERLEKTRGKGRFAMPMVLGDVVLGRLFPHSILPHYVWIDASGRVLGSTGLEELRADRILGVLGGKGFEMVQKVDAARREHDGGRLLVEQGLVVDSPGGFFYGAMGRFVEGLQPRMERFAASERFGQRVVVTNYTPLKLLQLSFLDLGNFDMRNTVLELADASVIYPPKGADVGLWRKGHGVCYERSVPLGSNLYDFMRKDMGMYFPACSLSVARRRLKCLALVETGGLGSYRASGEGRPLREISEQGSVFRYLGFNSFITPLFGFYLQGIPMPIVDATGYKGLIDIRIEGSLRDLEGINRSLAGYGLKLEERLMETEVLLVSDAVKAGKGADDE